MKKLKVLLIEDNEVSRKSLKRVIDKEEYETITANDGEAGLELFKKENPEIVVSDLKLPGISGIEVLHRIKKQSPVTEVIIMTAHGDYEIAINALRDGAIDYLKKPVDIDQLIVALGRCVEKIAENRVLSIKPNILLIEDEDVTRKTLSRILSKEGWDIQTAADGEAGMEVFRNNKIDIVMADIKMPKKDGMEVLHDVRKITHDCEVIIITGYGDESSAIQALRDGAINYLRKPIDIDLMIVSVKKAFDRLKMRRSILYKIREIELSKEIIAKISRDKEIIVDLRDYDYKPARDFAQRLLDMVPLGLMVVDKDMKIIYSNEQLKRVVGFEPEFIGEKLMNKLHETGIKGMDEKALKKSITKYIEKKSKDMEIVIVGDYAYSCMLKMIVIESGIKQEVVLLLFRGERNN